MSNINFIFSTKHQILKTQNNLRFNNIIKNAEVAFSKQILAFLFKVLIIALSLKKEDIMKRILCLILVFVSLFAFASCSSKKKKEETLKIEEEISQEISAEKGGKIENSDKSISIEVPGEALEIDTKITMKIYDAGKYIGTEGKDFISKVVEFEPSGIIFKKPVIITMTSLKDVENKIISAAVYRDEKGEWSYSKRGAYVILTGRDEGGDPIMKSAGGDPIMLNPGGDPIMIPEDGGDPIMLSAGGDPIMVKAGGDPIMQDEGGDPIMHDDGGDPIMNAAGGDPIMNAAGGDPIMMTTGHFTAYGFIALEPTGEEAVENPDKDDEVSDNDIIDGPVGKDDDEITDKDENDTEITEDDEPTNDEDEISDNDDDNIEITEDDDAINDEDETPDEIEDVDSVVINPCEGNPCQEIANSTHECLIQDDGYACACNTGYAWNGAQCVVPLGRICTGQDKCYDNEGEIECPAAGEDFYGQDAQYAALGTCVPQSFTIDDSVAGEAVVIDNNTGLIWQQSPSEEHLTQYDAITYCENLTYAGYDDWRLPSLAEMFTTVNIRVLPAIDTAYFPNITNYDESYFFTSTEYNYGTVHGAHSVNYWEPYSETIDNTGKANVMCVRGNKLPTANFMISEIDEDTVVTDSTTGLIWQKIEVKQTTWQDILSYCENLEYAGYSDWRLPNLNELKSLLNNNSTEPYSDFPNVRVNDYCSSSTLLLDTSENLAWIIFLKARRVEVGSKLSTNNFYVKCVRSDLPSNSERTAACTGLPENAEWNSVSTITQTWNGSAWLPSATAVYSEEASTENCRFKCAEGFEWNDYECVRTTPLSLGNICTGQDKCYDDYVEIECPAAGEDFYGQDAQYAALGTCVPQSFAVHTVAGDNIVIDRNTKLIWQQSPSEEVFTWDDAITYCENLTYAGKTGWRLPAPQEFLTIVSLGDAVSDYFLNMSGVLWTSKVFGEESGSTVYSFHYTEVVKYINTTSKENSMKVMCVYGGEFPTANLSVIPKIVNEINYDLVFDSTTDLMWQKTYSEEPKEWKDALSYCENLEYADYSDWRLPNANELATLVNFDKTEAPYSDFPELPSNIEFRLWSSSTPAGFTDPVDGSGAMFIDFNTGLDSAFYKVNNYYVLCVRSE